jgi:hypothetical protein
MTRITNTLMATCAAFALTITGGAPAAHATHFTGGEILYLGGATTGDPTTYPRTVQTEILSMNLSSIDPTGEVVPLPLTGDTYQIDSFFDVFVELNIGGEVFQIDSFFDITYLVTGNGGGNWSTEMVALSLTGQAPGGGPSIVLRESSSLPSPGQIVVSDLPDGTFQIDSFFDVFIELSVDGEPFVPADSSTQIVMNPQLPEPASAALLGLGVLALVRRDRRSASQAMSRVSQMTRGSQ